MMTTWKAWPRRVHGKMEEGIVYLLEVGKERGISVVQSRDRARTYGITFYVASRGSSILKDASYQGQCQH